MRVELLHHFGCPSAPAAHQLVQDCLTALAIGTPVLVRVGAYPSPTVLVDGTDVMTATGVMSPGHACRLDLPTQERVLAALTAQRDADTPR
jgi:hypothetical protein